MLVLLPALACTAPADEPLPAPVVPPVATYGAQSSVTYGTVAPVAPAACPETIQVARAGNSTDPPEDADAHAEIWGDAPEPYGVHLGWTGDPSDSVAIVWRTDIDTLTTQVEVGPDESLGTVVEGRSFLLGDGSGGRVHEVHVCGLAPGTSWHYRVGGVAGWSPIYRFTTAPPAGSAGPIVFGVAGDTRGDPATWERILDGMADHGVEFRLFTGDAVTVGSTLSYWDDWYEAGEGTMESIPTLMAHGNHEALAQAYFALAAQPGNEEWYSFDYGPVHFAAWNDTVASTADWSTQSTWLASDLAGTTRPWKAVFHHKAAYSGCKPNGEDGSVRLWFVPVEEAAGVQVDFAGHNHNYERSVPLHGGVEVPQADGTTYIVTAGGGAPLYENNQAWSYTATYSETEHYVIGVADANTMTLTAYDLAGNVIDSVTLAP